jgi:hypothetical protein
VLDVRGKEGPMIRGCKKCDDGKGVPDSIARTWPEAYRAMGNELGKLKKATLVHSEES